MLSSILITVDLTHHTFLGYERSSKPLVPSAPPLISSAYAPRESWSVYIAHPESGAVVSNPAFEGYSSQLQKSFRAVA